MQNNYQISALERAISGFANTVAAIGALFLIPYVAGHYRVPVYRYIYSAMDYEWAYWGSWVFVALCALCFYFGSSSLLQVIVQYVFRRGARKAGF